MLLNSFDDYMLYRALAHLFHVSIGAAYWITNGAITVILLAFILVYLLKQ